MSLFLYSGRSPRGEPVKGSLEAESEEAVAARLQQDGVTPISIVASLDAPLASAPLTQVARRMGLGRSGDAEGHFLTLIELLLARLPLPRRLGDLEGLARDRIPDYARLAMLDHCHRTNPRPCTEADMEDLLERAW